MFLAIFFTCVGMWAYHRHDADMASFATDLAKELVACFLTLTVGARLKSKTPTPTAGE